MPKMFVVAVLLVCLAVPCMAQDIAKKDVPATAVDKWEVSGIAAVAPANKAGWCLSREVYRNDDFAVWLDAGPVNDAADGGWGGFFGASTDAYFVPLLSKWFSEHVTAKARYGVGYAVPSTDVLLYVRIPVTSF